MTEQRFFHIIQEGRFDPAKIKVNWAAPGWTIRRTSESEAYLAQKWQEHLARGNKPWPNDLKPTRVRLARFDKIGDGAEILLDPCVRYHDSSGANSPEFEQRFGHEAVPNALAVSVLLETADNKMAVSVRNKKTDYKWRGYHCSIGGYFNFTDYKDASKADKDPTSAALRELVEEVGVTKDDIAELHCIGAVYDNMALHTDIIYHARTNLSAADVLKRTHDDENVIKMVPNDKPYIEGFIGGFPHASVVIPLATLLIVGTERFGADWRQSMLDMLAERSECLYDPARRLQAEQEDIELFQQYISKF